jgi:serine beta-lactamase-like protein LACTB, mitochondrial
VHDKQKNVGVQAAIYRNGRIVFSEAIGLTDRVRKSPVTRDTAFPIASVTKAFTGVAALKAHAAGKLHLDVPIQAYVPEFPVKPELVITPRRLAAHRAGIRHWGDDPAYRNALLGRHFDRLGELLPAYKDEPLQPGAGADYQYSSIGYNLFGLAIERATGAEFKDYVRRQILRPLRLSKTRFDDARSPRPDLTELYSFYDLKTFAELTEPVRVPMRDYSHNMAGGNMSATAEDLVRFGAALLRPGFLPPRQHAMLFERPSFGGAPTAMSFGFFAPEAEAERVLRINGANPGVMAALSIYPERKLVVAILANSWGIGSRSGEMTSDLPKRLAELCRPYPLAGPASRP